MNPADLAIDTAGRIYVADFGNLRIQVFEPDGTFLGQVKLPGVEEAAVPASVGIANGELYVTPFGSPNILVYRLLLEG
jgi:sugar lactone lactonase YvrE